MKIISGWIIGLVFGVSALAEPLLEGRVRLESGEPVADAQVRIFDLSDLRQGAIARALTDGTGYFALPLATLGGPALPVQFALGPNYPNPFNPSTIIPYQLAASSEVRLEVFNLLGQHLVTLVDGERPAGSHTATWHATDAAGRAVGAGVYIYRMTVGVERQTGRMVLLDGQAGVSAGGMASVMPGASDGSGPNGESEEYGLIVSGRGLAPYVDSAFRVEAGMAPVELVVSAGGHSMGKALDDNCAFCDLFDALNDAQEGAGAGPSGKAQATLDAPAAPTNLRFEAVTDSSCRVRWDAAEGATDYDVNYKRAVSGKWTNEPHKGVRLYNTIYDLAPNTEYRWAARAENGDGPSEWVFGPNFTTLPEEDETPEEEADETLTISSDMVTLPPPTWVFAGDVPADDQTVLREEMEYSRAYFRNRFGVEATDFTVLVGSDYEALAPVYRDIVGRDLSDKYPSWAITTSAWATSSPAGGALVTLIYGKNQQALDTLKEYIVHEYFHVLQGQLASGFAQLPNSEVAYYDDTIDHGPTWLKEGLASYADYAYTPSRPGRRPFLNDRYTPYFDVLDFRREWGVIRLEDLDAEEEDYRHLGCSFGNFYVYAMGFAASVYLLELAEEDSYVNFWQILGERPTWQQAFEEAFGIGVNDFYKAFEEWLPSQLPPPLVTLKLQVRWPDMENQLQGGEFLSVEVANWGTWENERPSNLSSASTGWFGKSDVLSLVIAYDEGAIGTGYLSLWWYHRNDLCTEYLLGWYKDGELTSRREDATSVEFTGSSRIIDWNIPGNPDTLPRLEERVLCN